MAHDVFISYSTKNTEYANTVCERLEENGIECWIAPRNIKTGTNFAKEIMDGLNTAKIVVLIFSKFAQESEYVNNEIDTAFSKNKHIVSLKVDDSFPHDQMQFFLKNTQWLDASPTALEEGDITLESCYEQLVDDVQRVLENVDSNSGAEVTGVKIAAKEKSFFDRYKLPIIAVALVLIAVVGFVAYSGMSENANSEKNETGITIGYVGLEDYGSNSYSYFVFGTISPDLTNSSDNVVHVDFYDKSGKVVDSCDTKVSDIEGNILGSIDVSEKNVAKVAVELQNKDKKVLYKAESDNILEQ